MGANSTLRNTMPRLREIIDEIAWIDSHEHLVEERSRLCGRETYRCTDGMGEEAAIPGDWTALLVDYALDDLIAAGLREPEAESLRSEHTAPDAKWRLVESAIHAARHTGYMRAVDVSTKRLFGLRLSKDSCLAIDEAMMDLRRPGYYRQVLREVANIEYCQVNSIEVDPYCPSESPDLLRQDLSILALVTGRHPEAEASSGISVECLEGYEQLLRWCFATYGPEAVAVKCSWAYYRNLAVRAPSIPPVREYLKVRQLTATADERRRVEDYLFDRCLTLAGEYELPVKLHLGYLAGNSSAQLRHVFHDPMDVTPVVQRHPGTTFVLMHMAWPQQEQLVAVAKHHANVFVDLCWAWIVAPLATRDFVARFITSVPYTKLLCFGGDYSTVENVVGHAELARDGLHDALAHLVSDSWLKPADAVDLVPELMRGNAERVFASRSPIRTLGASQTVGRAV